MRTLTLTQQDFKQVGSYKEYSGKEDLTNFDGNLEFAANLGWLKFERLKASGYILIQGGLSGYVKSGDWTYDTDELKQRLKELEEL